MALTRRSKSPWNGYDMIRSELRSEIELSTQISVCVSSRSLPMASQSPQTINQKAQQCLNVLTILLKG